MTVLRVLVVAASIIGVVAAGTAVRAHRHDMRRLRETGIATRNFLAGKVHAETEAERERQIEAGRWGSVTARSAWTTARGGTRLPDELVPTMEELRALGYIQLHSIDRTADPTPDVEEPTEPFRWPPEEPTG